MHPYDDAVEYIKATNDTEEARAWLERMGSDYGVIHELSREESIEAVEEAYRWGAECVEVVGSIADDPADNNVNMILITLPHVAESRKWLFSLEETVAGMHGYQRSRWLMNNPG